ncbi:sporangia induced hypothetical protein, partial [Thraustotheca clavata]
MEGNALSAWLVPTHVVYQHVMVYLSVRERWENVALVCRAWRLLALASVKVKQHLDLSWCRGNHELQLAITTLLTMIPNNALATAILPKNFNHVQLQSISLYGPRVTPAVLLQLVSGISPMQLKRIDLESKWLEADGFAAIAKCQGLEFLCLNCIKLTDNDLIGIAMACTNLKSLNIAGCSRVGDDGILGLARYCLQLEELDISMCIRVTDASLIVLAHSISNLVRLSVEKCLKITEASLSHVASQQQQLKELSVANCPKVRDIFLAAFRMDSQLKTLVLNGCASVTDMQLGMSSLGCLSAYFKFHGQNLLDLDLTGLTNLTSDTFKMISLCLNLQSLNLSMCRNLNNEDIATITTGCTALQKVSFQGCVLLNDAALHSLAGSCNNLRDVSLVFCYNITDVGFCALIHGCPKLTHLNVKACNLLTELSFVALAQRKGVNFIKLVIGACARLIETASYAHIIKQAVYTILTMRATSLPMKLSQKSLDTLHEHHNEDIPPIKSAPMLSGLDNNRGFRRTSYLETNCLHKSCDITTGHKQLNQYILYDVIGKGAYGKVRKAFWPEKNKYYAHAKKPILRGPRALAIKDDGLEKIRREFAIWKKLQHPNIVCLKEVIDAPESNKIYMISELIEGRPLLDGESKCTPLNEDTAKHCFCQLIEGLDFLHFHKIIHRDIKPTNLLFSSEGIVKITDFGQSQVIQDEDDYFRQTVGTGPFLAPEMLTGGAYKGLPIDLWAAGVTLFLFIYGHLPFQAATLPELYEKIK